MTRDAQRILHVCKELEELGLDAIVCSLPSNVLMLSGYCPVIGTSIAVLTKEGRLFLLVPEDESELTSKCGADQVRTFHNGSLSEICSTDDMISGPIDQLLRDFNLTSGRIGHDGGSQSQPATYAAMHFYGSDLPRLIADAAPEASLFPAEYVLSRLRSIKTSNEVSQIRKSCAVASNAFSEGRAKLRAGLTEAEVAADFRRRLAAPSPELLDRQRVDGFVYCMSGPNAYEAYGAWQRSRGRRLSEGDLVLVHCNSNVGGYWTDITRTYLLGEGDERARRMLDAILDARQAALDIIRPGVRAADVDAAARNVLTARGFGKEFKHPTGHGVGFAAINHNARPRLHPATQEVLEPGMVFNVEPGIYIENYAGARHCEMVAVTDDGMELLTPFQTELADLLIS